MFIIHPWRALGPSKLFLTRWKYDVHLCTLYFHLVNTLYFAFFLRNLVLTRRSELEQSLKNEIFTDVTFVLFPQMHVFNHNMHNLWLLNWKWWRFQYFIPLKSNYSLFGKVYYIQANLELIVLSSVKIRKKTITRKLAVIILNFK